jgi:hypothetical protein
MDNTSNDLSYDAATIDLESVRIVSGYTTQMLAASIGKTARKIMDLNVSDNMICILVRDIGREQKIMSIAAELALTSSKAFDRSNITVTKESKLKENK